MSWRAAFATLALLPGAACAQRRAATGEGALAPEPRVASCAAARGPCDSTARGGAAPMPMTEATPARVDAPPAAPALDASRRGRLDARGRAIRAAALRASDLRVLVSIGERRLWVLDGDDTVRVADVAVGMDQPLVYGGRRWTFHTPRGIRHVRAKFTAATWRPPDWGYAEVAREHGLRLRTLPRAGVRLRDGRKLVIRDSLVGMMLPDGFAPLPVDEHIVFDGTLFIPPLATYNRRIDGELGAFQLDLGEGYLLHGTPREETIGTATTHGCLRLRAEDLAWLHERLAVGTRVYLF